MKLCEYVNMCLNKLGVKKIFGIPGSLIMPIWQSIDPAEIILCSHEQEASYVATGYAKMSRQPVAVITTGCPGVTNSISGIASANIDSIPLIYISGRTPIDHDGTGLRQEESSSNRKFEAIELLKCITKRSITITNINTAAEEIFNCMCFAIRERKGAVHISIPIDFQDKELPTQMEELKFNSTINVNCDQKLQISNNPLIVIGWGAWMSNSFDAIYNLASQLDAPIVVTSKAYCCIKKNHPNYLGKLGYGYTDIIGSFISHYSPDSILIFGSSIGEKDFPKTIFNSLFKKTEVNLVSDEPYFGKWDFVRLNTYISQDITDFIETSVILPCKKKNTKIYRQIDEAKNRSRKYWEKLISEGDKMAKVIKVIDEEDFSNIVIVPDAGNHLANTATIYEPKNFGELFIDVGIRAMGSGICSSVGMAIANRRKIYIAITGDGCMLMNGNVMHLAKTRELPIIFIVFNNNSLGRVRVGQSKMNDYRASDISNVDYQYYGKTFGLKTFKFSKLNDFKNNISMIINRREPSLIEIMTSKDEIPLMIKDNIY